MSLLKPNHVFSYSQLSSFEECPYGFYLQRIEHQPQQPNGFAEQGILIHELIDEWAKGLVSVDDLPGEYEKRYPEAVVTQFPRMLAGKGYAQKTYEAGLRYFQTFDGFAGYDILETEAEYHTEIAGRPFVGIVDMILKDQATNELIILDHKSKSLSSFKKKEKEMYRQQMLYAKFVYEKLGVWPDRLMFNLFKEDGLKMEQPFMLEEYNETLRWATSIIEQIENFEFLDWLTQKEKSDFFCQEICSMRKLCDNGTHKR